MRRSSTSDGVLSDYSIGLHLIDGAQRISHKVLPAIDFADILPR
jgi:hypothetical protein